MTYSSVDHYLGNSGQLGFLLTQTLFKSSDAGEGFRRFRYEKDGKVVWIRIEKVWDLGPIKPFEGAANHTAVLLCKKGDRPTVYPVPYFLVRGPLFSDIDVSSADVKLRRDYAIEELGALPIAREINTSPWITVTQSCLGGLLKAVGKSDYRARVGVFSGGLNGCFWIRILQATPEGDFLVQNIADAGKKSVISRTARIEGELIYPLVRGRDIRRWVARPSEYLVLVNEVNKLAAIPEATMKSKYPKTYAYLKMFETQLRARRGYTAMRLMEKGPFYAISEVGPYTVAPIKVMWRQMIPQLRMAVTMPRHDAYLGAKVAVTQHVVTQVVFETQEEAFYFCALGNSSIATLVNQSYSAAKSYGTPQLLDHLRIPRYREAEETHRALSQLGRRAHEGRAQFDAFETAEIEAQVDQQAAKLWGLSMAELGSIQKASAKSGNTRRARTGDDDEEVGE